MAMNVAFFNAVRSSLFGGRLSQGQVDGLELIINTWDQIGDGDDRKLAYILATAKHETAHTMQPVRETLASSDAQAIARLDNAMARGQLPQVSRPYWREGWFGRGYVQLTHKANYERAGRELGLDLVGNPSLAMESSVAAHILIRGMMEGWFTTQPLGRYITAASADYRNARRVVNGLDRADAIAKQALDFERALRAGGKRAPVSPTPPDKPPTRTGIIVALIIAAALVASFFLTR